MEQHDGERRAQTIRGGRRAARRRPHADFTERLGGSVGRQVVVHGKGRGGQRALQLLLARLDHAHRVAEPAQRAPLLLKLLWPLLVLLLRLVWLLLWMLLAWELLWEE